MSARLHSFTWRSTSEEHWDTSETALTRLAAAQITAAGCEVAGTSGGVDFTRTEPRADDTLIVECDDDTARNLTRLIAEAIRRPVTRRPYEEEL